MIACNLLGIGDATSLHMSAHMVQKRPKHLQTYEDFIVFCLIVGLARSLCAYPTPCNLSNVKNTDQWEYVQLGVHLECN